MIPAPRLTSYCRPATPRAASSPWSASAEGCISKMLCNVVSRSPWCCAGASVFSPASDDRRRNPAQRRRRRELVGMGLSSRPARPLFPSSITPSGLVLGKLTTSGDARRNLTITLGVVVAAVIVCMVTPHPLRPGPGRTVSVRWSSAIVLVVVLAEPLLGRVFPDPLVQRPCATCSSVPSWRPPSCTASWSVRSHTSYVGRPTRVSRGTAAHTRALDPLGVLARRPVGSSASPLVPLTDVQDGAAAECPAPRLRSSNYDVPIKKRRRSGRIVFDPPEPAMPVRG